MRTFLRTDAYREAASVMFFMTHGSEVLTDDAIRSALAEGKTVALPRIDPKTGVLSAVKVVSLDEDLVTGAYGIREPRSGKRLRPGSLDAVLVPGLAFDRAGNRIGYGKGYYDRWLCRIKREKRISLAYDLQIVRAVPHTSLDLPVGMIITEKRVLRCMQNKKRK